MFSSRLVRPLLSAVMHQEQRAYHAGSLHVSPRPSRIMATLNADDTTASVSLQIQGDGMPGRVHAWTPLLTLDVGNNRLSPWTEEEQAPLMRAWLISPDNIVPLEQLYAIEAKTWNQFLKKLERQELVKALGLHTHRHIWRGYEFACAASTPELALQRANIIGQHHFLLSIAFMPFETLIKIRNFSEFPLYIFNTSLAEKEAVYTAIREDLHNGHFDAAKMQALHPVFTPEFLKKIEHCTNLSEVDRLAWMAMNYADMPGVTHAAKTRLMEATERMPSSQETPADFDGMMRLGGELFKSSSAGVAGGFLFNGTLNWPRDREKMVGFFTADHQGPLSRIQRYTSALYDDLVYGQIRREFPDDAPEHSAHYLYHFPRQFQALLADRQSILEMQQLQQHWHQKFVLLETLKPCAQHDCWEPLIDNFQAGDFFVHALTTGRDLRILDAHMAYGVGGFSRLCLANTCNLLHITDARGRQTIVSLGYSKTREAVVLKHFGAHGRLPFPEHVQLVDTLVKGINTGIIPINLDRRNTPPVDVSLSIYPWPLEDNELQESVYAIWKQLELLPSVLNAPNYAAMLAQSGIMERMHEEAERSSAGRVMP